jgi:hypothetical protein
MGYATTPSPPSPQPPSPFPSIANFADPAYYETLYRQAQAGEQSTVGATTIHTQLVGQTTIAGKSVYELAFTFHFTPPSNPPPGDMCGSTVCSTADREVLLYLDSQTFTPVRTVYTIVNTNDNPGIPPGSAVWIVTDYSVQSLPDTPANEALLQMAPHPGATQVQSTYAQYRAEHGLNPATGSTTTTGASGATGSTGQAGTTGSTGTSASGASGAGGTTAAN